MVGHRRLQLGADAERVVHDHLAQVVEAAVEPLQPGRGALQPVGGADVEHEEPVDEPDQRLGRRGPRRAARRGAGSAAAVAADVEVPAVLGGDDADVLAAASAHSRAQPETADLSLCGERSPR